MNFLKKHWEKVLLVVILLSVIGAAGWLVLKVDTLSEELESSKHVSLGKGKPVPAVDQDPYQKAISTLENPLQWELGQTDPFKDKFIPPPPKPVLTDTPPVDETQIKLLKVERVPFKMNFKAYIGDGQNLQIDFKFRPRTFFIEKVGDSIKDQFEDTGYKVVKFEKKEVELYNPSIGVTNLVDVSELSIQRESEKPKIIILNREAEEEEPVATVRCETTLGGAADFRVRRGQMFKCGGKTYKVVDITPNGMIIIDIQTEEKQTLPVSRDSEETPRGARPW